MAFTNEYEQACISCGSPTNEACDNCKKIYCNGHLFQTGLLLNFPSDPRNEDYTERPEWKRREEICLSCYLEKTGHPPFILWQETAQETHLSTVKIIQAGHQTSAGDSHLWASPPRAGEILNLRYGAVEITLDSFRTVQLLDFLTANEEEIRANAKRASDILVPEAQRLTRQAKLADLGIYRSHPEE